MPGRNIVKQFGPDNYYHLYNRGVNKGEIFHDKEDYLFFKLLFARYLDVKSSKDNKGREYPWFGDRLSLLAYCLMPNHFHLLIYQEDETAMTEFMLGFCTAYTMYYNKKYKRRGPLFENHYRASLIDQEKYLQHISRYIHLNPKNYKQWPYSSLQSYLGQKSAEGWLRPGRILQLFDSVKQYQTFVSDYTQMQRELETIKRILADTLR